MKELDVLLERYLERYFCDASSREQEAFRRLLETQDPVLHAYCLGSEPPPPEFVALIERITVYPGPDRTPSADRKPDGRHC